MVLLHARKGGSGGGGGGGSKEEEEELVLGGRAKKGMRLGKYELGRILGEGNFGKVKYARNLESGQPFAIKILEKNRILDLKITDQIKREIGTLKLLKHPNVVRLYEVLASKAKIYMVLEYVNGGELFERIASKGKFTEAKGRKLFQQLIDGVSYCHNKGVFHRDLKLENVLIDASGSIKITDFGLSALPQHLRDDGLLHTTCGSPNYVAPEILSNKGYDGASSDTWSCGVILYVILTGYLPFDDRNLAVLYQKIFKGEAQIPKWLSPGAKNLIKRILDPNPHTRITLGEIKENDWFKQDYTPLDPMEEEEEENVCIDDEVSSINDTPSDAEKDPDSHTLINAFQLIGMSSCLDLSGFFEKEDVSERKIRFTSHHSPKELLERIENTVIQMGFHVQKKNGKLKVVQERKGQKAPGCLSVAAEVFEISPSLYVVELQKAYGDPLVYRQLCNKLSNELGVSRSEEQLEAADL
ncbi:CBL-interacting serine/threonine-protein kinase 1-like [Sesamum indicum]|uniref:non-specific serine/threonine protein kinase n=1 Tax=Sesamum indicum TaxID=4182 RepID=A0A6I9SMU9_SESIN|nr:CBL-interacting serine/threonine-protein kinase 1-like [Sesamum indicum]